MQTFTYKEKQYVSELEERNIIENFKNDDRPLNKPMSVNERILRSRIKKKLRIYIDELVRAELAGIKLFNKSAIENVRDCSIVQTMEVLDNSKQEE